MGRRRLTGLKSHDYNVLVQQIIPASIWRFLHLGARDVVIQTENVFKWLCAKVINVEKLKGLMIYTLETMSLMEIWFPPGFFNSIEWYLYNLKKYAQNRYSRML